MESWIVVVRNPKFFSKKNFIFTCSAFAFSTYKMKDPLVSISVKLFPILTVAAHTERIWKCYSKQLFFFVLLLLTLCSSWIISKIPGFISDMSSKLFEEEEVDFCCELAAWWADEDDVGLTSERSDGRFRNAGLHSVGAREGDVDRDLSLFLLCSSLQRCKKVKMT